MHEYATGSGTAEEISSIARFTSIKAISTPRVDAILAKGNVSQKEATFCLLDQRTFECQWKTLLKIAKYKKSENKIEILYFLANSWLDRAFSAQKDEEVLAKWWGRADWHRLRDFTVEQRRDAFVDRLKTDLGYKSVKALPISKREGGGALMYFLIHATDHPEAPKLMSRAYREAVFRTEPVEQMTLEMPGKPHTLGALPANTAKDFSTQL